MTDVTGDDGNLTTSEMLAKLRDTFAGHFWQGINDMDPAIASYILGITEEQPLYPMTPDEFERYIHAGDVLDAPAAAEDGE